MAPSTAYSVKFVETDACPWTSRMNLSLEVHRTGFLGFKEKDFSDFHVEVTLIALWAGGQKVIRRKLLLEGPDLEEASSVGHYISSLVEPAPTPVRRFAVFKRQVGQVQFSNIRVLEIDNIALPKQAKMSYRWEARLCGPKRARCWEPQAGHIFRSSIKTTIGKFASARCVMTACHTGGAGIEIKFYPKWP